MHLHTNILSDDNYNSLLNITTGNYFAWYHYATSLHTELSTQDNDFMFAHSLYDVNTGINSPQFAEFIPLLNTISAYVGKKHTNLLRIKANLYTNSGVNITHEQHEDYPELDSYTTAVYNLTTCNGGTKFYKPNKFFESVQNSLLVFDGKSLHSGVTQSDTSIRVLVNFDFE